MRGAAKILRHVKRGVKSAAYNNLLYRKMLAAGETPTALRFTPPDLWPGDAHIGLALIAEQQPLFDSQLALRRPVGVQLRSLRAAGTDAARAMCLTLIEKWLAAYDDWHDNEWAPDVLGERIASWIGFYEFYAPAAGAEVIGRITASLVRQWRHLLRTMPPHLIGLKGLHAIKGLVYGGLNFPEGERALGLACDLLRRQMQAEILPDGGPVMRNPSVALHMLRHLIDLRTALQAAGLEVPGEAQTAIDALVPVIKFFRHGDGGLSLFHGSFEETPLLIDAVLTLAAVRGRALRRLPESGFERLSAGRGLLLMDCGRPPPREYSELAHAGLLSFEFGVGRERLIVNCGAIENPNPEWRSACAATAAHSTLTLEDTNACEVLMSGKIESSARVEAHRYEQDGNHFVDARHDGYRSRFGMMHRRLLGLSQDGDELQGRETLKGPAGRHYVLRWHLHPNVQASLAQSGQTALLRLPSGGGWRLRIEEGALELESSIYCGSGVPRRSLQLKTSGKTQTPDAGLNWSLTREKKN